MKEAQLRIFLDGLMRYFAQTTNVEAVVDTPFLSTSTQSLLLGFTGRIKISGSHFGDVIFTASHRMLTAMLTHRGQRQTDKTHLLDLVGEIANTITGNARDFFGEEFEISTPDTVRGGEIALYHQTGLKSHCIPLEWNGQKAMLIISATPNKKRVSDKASTQKMQSNG